MTTTEYITIEGINYKLILDLYEKCLIDFIYSRNDFRYSVDQDHPELKLIKSKGLFEGIRILAKQTYDEWMKLVFDKKSLLVEPKPCGICENCVHINDCKEKGCTLCNCYSCIMILRYQDNEADFTSEVCDAVKIGSVMHCVHGENADVYEKYIMDTYKEFSTNCHEQCLVKSDVSD